MKKAVAWIMAILIGVGAGLWVEGNFAVAEITDTGMAPNYKKGDMVLLKLNAYEEEEPKKGDVVALVNPIYTDTGEAAFTVKRVVGTVGEEMTCFSEGHAPDDKADYGNPVVEGYVYLLGDNMENSTDSRSYIVGQVRISDILGKVIYKW